MASLISENPAVGMTDMISVNMLAANAIEYVTVLKPQDAVRSVQPRVLCGGCEGRLRGPPICVVRRLLGYYDG